MRYLLHETHFFISPLTRSILSPILFLTDGEINKDNKDNKDSRDDIDSETNALKRLKDREREAGKRFERVRMELLRESPALKVAVKNFEVRAGYSFWMDVTVKEANKMYVHRDRINKDLVCSFHLDLPELCLDMTSSQFYIGINVIKNVLLAPPPAMAASIYRARESGANSGDDDETDNDTEQKVTELFRDSLLVPQDVRGVQNELNLKNRQSREEVKSLIEEYFNKAPEVKYGMAREVELFIGKGTWILRSPTVMPVVGPTLSQSLSNSLSPSYDFFQ